MHLGTIYLLKINDFDDDDFDDYDENNSARTRAEKVPELNRNNVS